MSILRRFAYLLRSELGERFTLRPWIRRPRGARRAAPRGAADQRHGRVGARTEARPRSTALQDPVQDQELANYYANLELPYGADVDAVRTAWRRLVKQYHPDLHSANPQTKRTATELVQGLNRAHEELVKRLERK